MNDLYAESWAVVVAFIITLGYTISPGPYWMGAFTFIAQPLFVLAIAGYFWKVYQDLRKNKII
ncbi:MAG: hypothetical protein FD167_541 [bacterium]|nr:MAG: hypothetical protein FD167_541 [bacterium]